MKIILGSQSKHRRKILTEMGYEFETMSADIDEKAIRHDDPKQLTLMLAETKANVLLDRINEPAILITADSVITCNGELLEKPENADQARDFFKKYAVHPAVGVTSVVVVNTETGARKSGVDITRVYFRRFGTGDIEQLIQEGNIFHYAGGFSLFEPLVKKYEDKFEGEEESMEGLPKSLTQTLLQEINA